MANGQEAKEKVEAEDFDVIVSDNSMPGFTGAELLVWVRTQSHLSGVRFILMSADAFDENGEYLGGMCELLGADFLRKPEQMDQLQVLLAQ